MATIYSLEADLKKALAENERLKRLRADFIEDFVERCPNTRAVGLNLDRVERCAGAKGHRSVCFGGVPPPPPAEEETT